MSDRRVRRTRNALREALIELIVERGYGATTVADIAERADVGRSTFYVHFADKEDLLRGSIDALAEWVDEQVGLAAPVREGHPALAFVTPMLAHADERRDIFRAFSGRQSGQLVQDLFHALWTDLIRKAWPRGDELAVHALAGAFGATVTWWLSDADHLSPEQIEARFRAFATPALAGR